MCPEGNSIKIKKLGANKRVFSWNLHGRSPLKIALAAWSFVVRTAAAAGFWKGGACQRRRAEGLGT